MTIEQPIDLSRRGVLRGLTVSGVAVPLLAACGDDEPAATTDGGDDSPPETDENDGAVQGESVATADVPVGSGTIVGEGTATVVVTQPTEGEFKAFSGICTHQRCPVTQIEGAEIRCECHGSRYSVEDGSVVGGPAPEPLAELTATVDGDQVTVSG